MGSPAIFKGSYTKLLTASGLGLETGQKVKYTDGAALGSIPVSDGSGVLSLTAWSGINTGLNEGSIVFVGASGVLSQDNAELFWESANKKLGVGTNFPLAKLHIDGATDEIKEIVQGGAGQTAHLQEWRDSSSNVLASVGAAGQAKFTGQSLGIRSINFSTNLVANDYTALVSASGGNVTISLPAVAGEVGRVYVIKKTDATANSVIIDGNASETIDGELTQTITTQYAFIKIQSNGIGWHIIG